MKTTVYGFMGLPGAGKSRLVRALAREQGWPILDRDRIRQGLMTKDSDLERGKADAEAAMVRQLHEQAGHEPAILLDGMTLTRLHRRQDWCRLCMELGAQWQLVYLACPVSVATERVQADHRAGNHPAADRNAQLVIQLADRLQVPETDESAIQFDGQSDLQNQLNGFYERLSG